MFSTQERRWRRLRRELARGFRAGTCLLADVGWLCRNDVTLTENQRLASEVADALDAQRTLGAIVRKRKRPETKET